MKRSLRWMGRISLLVAISALVAATPVKLPCVVYGPGMSDPPPWSASGYMGNTGSVKVDMASNDHPHVGRTCMLVTFSGTSGWAGLVWQDPHDDWGTVDGGHVLTGAKKLTFWARGAQGNETVTFGYGIIGNDKPHHDSSKGELANTLLTADWKQYTIDLTGQDMSYIKTGFYWKVTAQGGAPVTFYVSEIKYE